MSDPEKTGEQWAAFQKIWLETFSKLGETAFTFNPQSAPPEILRNIRAGILQSLAKAWEEFLRSPQFLEGMKQWMDQAIAFRQASNDFMSKVRQESGSLSRADLDSVLQAIEHLERRLLDRIDEVSARVDQRSASKAAAPPVSSRSAPKAAKSAPRRPRRKST